MGLFDSLMGNASEVDPAKTNSEMTQVLAPGEQVEKAYQIFRDSFIFTNKRLILIDRQGLTGSKVQYHSIPYRSITHFTIETGGHFDLDAELKFYISGTHEPVTKKFNKHLSIYQLQSVLASYVLR